MIFSTKTNCNFKTSKSIPKKTKAWSWSLQTTYIYFILKKLRHHGDITPLLQPIYFQGRTSTVRRKGVSLHSLSLWVLNIFNIRWIEILFYSWTVVVNVRKIIRIFMYRTCDILLNVAFYFQELKQYMLGFMWTLPQNNKESILRRPPPLLKMVNIGWVGREVVLVSLYTLRPRNMVYSHLAKIL